MREIVERLHENRQIELAKSILESNGYKVSKRLKESIRVNESSLNWKDGSSIGSGDYYYANTGSYTIYLNEESSDGDIYYTITVEQDGIGEIDVDLPGEGWYPSLGEAKRVAEELVSSLR